MLEALAAVLLCALMLIPVVNVGIGGVAGFFLFGLWGAACGAFAGYLITIMVYKENPYL